jgi:hypothetical protein
MMDVGCHWPDRQNGVDRLADLHRKGGYCVPDIAHLVCSAHFANCHSSYYVVLALCCHCCRVCGNQRAVQVRRTPRRDLHFRDLNEVEPDVETAHLHACLRIVREKTDAYHLAVGY